MKSFEIFVVLFSMFLFITPVPGQTAETLYGITFNATGGLEQLLTIDTSTGLGTSVGNLDTNMAAYGLGTRNGNLYAYDQIANMIRQLDPLTAHTLNTIDIGAGDMQGEGGLAFRSDGIGFLSTACVDGGPCTFPLLSFDITVPSSTIIGTLSPFMDGLDFNSAGILYGISQAQANSGQTHELYTINQTTGVTTLIGNTGITDNDGLSGLAFRSDGVLFTEINDSLYTINPSNGQATLIGGIGFDHVSGLTFLEAAAPVSEPCTMLLIGTGLLGLWGARKKLRI